MWGLVENFIEAIKPENICNWIEEMTESTTEILQDLPEEVDEFGRRLAEIFFD